MGYYTHFKTKEIRLRKDTPEDVISFLNKFMNEGDYEAIPPNHKLFEQERGYNIFCKCLYGPPPFFKMINGYWVLFVNCDINYVKDEIKLFVEWIKPYVAGHKPKEYIGAWKWDDYDCPTINEYIVRVDQTINNQ